MIKFQPGDIVVVHAKGFNWLRVVTGLYWNHAMLIDEPLGEDYGLLESIDKGTAPTLLSNYKGQHIAVYRYIGITPDQQQAIRLAARKLGAYHYDFLIFFRILRRVGIRKGIRLIIQLWGKEYPLEIPKVDDKYIVCSEYCQQAYELAGIPLEDKGYLLTPDGLALCERLVCIYNGIY